MKLLSLHIENFGTLHDVDEQFDAALNVRLHPNGYGKSTLAVFIKAMLYGFPANTRRSLIDNERKRYAPWQGGAYGGSLDIEVGGKAYRIERLFGAKESDDTLTVLSLETGEAAREDWASAPGERLFGVGASAYERSTYISQRPDEMTKDGMDGIHTKLNGLADAADDLGNFDRAIAALGRRRQYYALLKGRGGAVANSEDALAEVDHRIESCEAARISLAAANARIDEANKSIAAIDEELEQLREQELSLGRAREARAIEDRIAALECELSALRAQVEQLRESLGGTVPTEATIEALRRALTAREELLHRTAPLLDESEARELGTLQARFGICPPDSDTIEALRGCAKDYNRATLLSAGAGYDAAVSDRSPDEQLGICREQLEQNSRQKAALAARLEQARTPVGGKMFAPMALIAGIAALGCLVGGIWLMPLFIAGGVLALVAIGATVGMGKSRLAAQGRLALIDHLTGEMSALDDAARTLKAAASAAEVGVRFAALWKSAVQNEPCPHGLDAPLETERLITQCDRLRTLCDKQKRAGNAAEQTASAKDSADAAIRALLSPMPGAPEDGARALLWLTEQRRLLLDCAERYEQKKKELAALREQYDTEGEAHRRALALLEGADTDELLSRRGALLSRRELWAQTLLREQQSAERLGAEADELDGLENERARRLNVLSEQKANLDAILKAEEFLKLARENLSGRYLETIRARFGHYMALLTGKQAPTFTMDGQFRVKIREAGAGRDSESFSVGVRDLIALCERFSLIDVMFEGERPFLVLDDPFTNLDDDTIAHAKELLTAVSERYQILYLTCHSGRAMH